MHVKRLDERVVERAKARDIDVLVYAPHFTRLPDVRSAAREFSDDDLLVVPAREVFTGSWRNRKHVLVLGLTDPIPDFITLDGAMAEIDRQNAVAVVPHPAFLNVGMSEMDVRAYSDLIDAVETFNPKHLPWDNRQARRIARATGKPTFTSSYAHLRGTIGEAWTAFDDPIETETDLLAALREHAPRHIETRPGVAHALRCKAEFAHLGWENSWGKIDRLLLSGQEETHPRHVAYGGQFDDVAVY